MGVCVYVYRHVCADTHRLQKKVWDLLELELQAIESCREQNLVTLQEQFMLLTSEPSLQILDKNLKPTCETPALRKDLVEL